MMRRFNRSFQTGTLGRSVRRFGRFMGRRPRTGFARRQFGFFYSTAVVQLQLTSSPEPAIISLVKNSDLAPAAGLATGAQVDVHNVSMDIVLMLEVECDLTASISRFGSGLFVHWGMFKQDVDEDITTLDNAMATNSLIRWDAMPVQAYSWNGSVSGSANPTLTQKTRQRFRMSTVKPDEELIFIANWSDDASKAGQLDAAFLSIAQRVRYEIP